MNDFVRGGLKEKLLYGMTAAQVLPRRGNVTVAHQQAREPAAGSAHNCIVLHGWGLDGSAMQPIVDALRRLPAAARWNFWNVTYDTQWTAFPDSAGQVTEALQVHQAGAGKTLLLGYSMGGIVARSMISRGFPCAAFISLCVPHLGAAPWMPTLSRGPRSIWRHSPMLSSLNKNPLEAEMRHRYHLFAINYQDALGQHEHDGIVSLRSALGDGLGAMAAREVIRLRYRGVATWDPHWRGKTTQCIAPVLARADELMQQL